MKYLFLDVDGVLNSVAWYEAREEMAAYHEARQKWQRWYWEWDDRHAVLHDQWQLDPQAVQTLDSIVTTTGCEVVVSSVWRGRRRDVFTEAMRRQGYTGRILSRTHHIEGHIDWDNAPKRSEFIRGMEIEHWLLSHTDRTDLSIVILDDESDMGRLLPWRVHIDGIWGLTPDYFDAIEEALERPVTELLATPNPYWTDKARETLYP